MLNKPRKISKHIFVLGKHASTGNIFREHTETLKKTYRCPGEGLSENLRRLPGLVFPIIRAGAPSVTFQKDRARAPGRFFPKFLAGVPGGPSQQKRASASGAGSLKIRAGSPRSNFPKLRAGLPGETFPKMRAVAQTNLCVCFWGNLQQIRTGRPGRS